MRYSEFSKEQRNFYLDEFTNEFNKMVEFIGCVEDVERIFGIEFACGIENDVPLFLSDMHYESPEFDKYDGDVIDTVFKYNNRIIDTTKNPCEFRITYNSEFRSDGSEEFSNPKIIIKGKGSRAPKTPKE